MPQGRPSQGKTATIKKRRIDVYAPTIEAKAKWDAEAERRNTSASRLIFDLAALALAAETGWRSGESAPEALPEQVEELQAQLCILRRKNEDLESLKERLERDLAELQAQLALGEAPLPNIGTRLVRLFSEAVGDGRPRPVTAAEIRQALRVDPGDALRLRELQQALTTLEVEGVIQKQTKGWVWLGK